MVISGGCASGSLYRMAEGYVGSWVSMAGIIVGLGLLSQTWNWWWTTLVSHESKVWLPSTLSLGYGGGVALTLAAPLLAFLLRTWWESRNGLSTPATPHQEEPQDTFGQKLSALWRPVFVRGWPAW